jgi:hypothetical protein
MVGVRGGWVAFESLLGMVCDCARRCLILSTDDRVLGDDCFAPGIENRGNVEVEGSVGVGGVTKVVGVSGRPGGVSGSDVAVFILPLRGALLGVCFCSSLAGMVCAAADRGVSGAATVSTAG